MKKFKAFQIEIYPMSKTRKKSSYYEINEFEDLFPILEKYKIKFDLPEYATIVFTDRQLNIMIGQLVRNVMENLEYILFKWV